MWHAGERTEKCTVLLGKPEGKRQLGISRRRGYGIRMGLTVREIGCGGVVWYDWLRIRTFAELL
jgi:hypothetical protein